MDVISVLLHTATARRVDHQDRPQRLTALRAAADLVRCVLGACRYRAELGLHHGLRSIGSFARRARTRH